MKKAACKYCGGCMLYGRKTRMIENGMYEAKGFYRCATCGAQSPETGWTTAREARVQADQLAGAKEVPEEAAGV